MKTDSFIQNVIRTKFTNTTVITIAHRINTISDYDKIIVMHKGRIIESGTAWQLIQKKGLFLKMVRNTGKNAALIENKAKNYHKKQMHKTNVSI